MTQNQIDYNKILQEINKIDLGKCDVEFYVAYRKFQNKIPYSLFQVASDKNITKLFLEFLKKRLQRNIPLIAYDYVTLGSFDKIQTTQASEIPLQIALMDVIQSDDIVFATKYDQLLNANFYIIKYIPESGIPLYAVRKITSSYNPKPKVTLSNLLWDDGKLIDVEKKSAFKLDEFFDYISYGEHLFIYNKSNFEYILNIRESLIRKKEEIINNMRGKKIISNLDEFDHFIGNNIHNLRHIAKVESANYYTNETYVKKMLALIKKKPNWNISINDGKIVVTAENLKDVFSVLTNSRLKSEINNEVFDTSDKQLLDQ
jgi:hypothetical protein